MKVKIYNRVTLPVLHGCETWFLTVGVERASQVFHNSATKSSTEEGSKGKTISATGQGGP
jgi:hypothetical protein